VREGSGDKICDFERRENQSQTQVPFPL